VEVITRLRLLLTDRERQNVRRVILLAVVTALFQSLAVLSIMPFMAMVADPVASMETPLAMRVGELFGWETPRELLIGAGSAVLGLVVLANILAALSVRRVQLTAWNINHFLSQRLLAVYLQRPYPWFLARHSGGLSRNLLEEVRRVVIGGLVPLMSSTVRGVEALFLLGLLLVVDPLLTLATGSVIGGSYLAIYFLLRAVQERLGETRSRATKTRFHVATEAMGGIKEIKSLGAEEEFLWRFGKTGPPYVRAEAWSQVITEVPRHLLEVLSLGTVLAVFLFLILTGSALEETLPVLVLFGFAGYKLVPSFHQVFAGASVAKYTLPSLREICADLEEGGNMESRPKVLGTVEPLAVNEGVEFVDVSVAYPGADGPALEGVSLRIAKGARVGVVGPSGSGKTTLVDVLLGLLPPQTGEIRVDGVPLTAANMDAWRAGLGYVPQTIFLSDDTVAQNIAFGRRAEDIKMEKVRESAVLAELDDFIQELPNGYETQVGERGVRLSGGQRQRIGIARALHRDPTLLLLDEATSALDGVTEEGVMDSIFGLDRRRTVVIIAHRLTTLRRCDRILLVERGRLVADGTWDELLESNDLFRVLAREGRH
jgi:ATP-binding cassette, subfamily B, bacterial PglK